MYTYFIMFQEAEMSSAAQLLDIVKELTQAHELFSKMEADLGHYSLQQANRSSGSTPKSIGGDSIMSPLPVSKSAEILHHATPSS